MRPKKKIYVRIKNQKEVIPKKVANEPTLQTTPISIIEQKEKAI